MTTSGYSYGGVAQLSYFPLPKRLEFAIRGGVIAKKRGGAFNDGNVFPYEGGAAVSYAFSGNDNIRPTADYTMLGNDGSVQNQNDHRLRL